jgi:hypothetical protein
MKAQARIVGLMIGIVIIILGLALAFPVKQAVDNARNESSGDTIGLNCSTSEDVYIRAMCRASDLSIFLFVGGLLFIAGIVITAKILVSR